MIEFVEMAGDRKHATGGIKSFQGII